MSNPTISFRFVSDNRTDIQFLNLGPPGTNRAGATRSFRDGSTPGFDVGVSEQSHSCSDYAVGPSRELLHPARKPQPGRLLRRSVLSSTKNHSASIPVCGLRPRIQKIEGKHSAKFDAQNPERHLSQRRQDAMKGRKKNLAQRTQRSPLRLCESGLYRLGFPRC
jgi:hypothetical protein